MQLRKILGVAAMAASVLLGAGCATKKYVSQNIEPMKLRVDSLDEKQAKQGETIDQLGKSVEENEVDISAAKERLGTVEGRVGDAFTKLGENEKGLNELRSRIANLDDYREAQQISVLFGFDKDSLTEEATQQLREISTTVSSGKRYFVTVEGYTDQIGSAEYNNELSQRRGDRVVRYLVAELGIPVHRIFVVGLGKERLVDTSNTREARARNRRVMVTLYSADPVTTASRDN